MNVSEMQDGLNISGLLMRGEMDNLLSWLHQAMTYRVSIVDAKTTKNEHRCISHRYGGLKTRILLG